MQGLVSEESLQADVQFIQNITVIPTLLNVICRITHMRFAAVARVTENKWITCTTHDEINFGLKPGDELKVETTLCHEVRQLHSPIIIDHVEKDTTYCNHHTPAMYGFQSYISMPILRKDGSFFGTLCALDPKPAKLNNAEVKGLFSSFADLISFHLQAVEQLEEGQLAILKEKEARANMLEQKNRELEKMNIELESFTYIASHDLKEPLRKIKTFSGRLAELENATLSAKGKNYLERMLASVDRMQNLIIDLMSYTQSTSAENIFETINLHNLVTEIKDDYASNADDEKVIIEVGDMCTARVIPFQLQQLFQNMMSNSIKFTKAGVTPVITISSVLKQGPLTVDGMLLPAKNYCHITITDNGIGFDQQYSDRIFKIFQRLHRAADYAGTGIGLSIVKKIVENHKGAITAHSQPNEGATFDIYLPQD